MDSLIISFRSDVSNMNDMIKQNLLSSGATPPEMLQFAQKFGLLIRPGLHPNDEELKPCYADAVIELTDEDQGFARSSEKLFAANAGVSYFLPSGEMITFKGKKQYKYFQGGQRSGSVEELSFDIEVIE